MAHGPIPTGEELRRVGAALRAVLPRSVRVKQLPGDSGEFLIDGVPVTARWAGRGWPRDVRRVLEGSEAAPDVVVARRLSEGAKAALIEAGIGWLDETGAAELHIDSIVIVRSRTPSREEPRISDRWTASILAVAEALLLGTRGTVSATQKVTGLSVGSCTKALRVLQQRGLVYSDEDRGPRSARTVRDPNALLDAYAEAAPELRPTEAVPVGVLWRDPLTELVEIGANWSKLGIDWACTGTAAAAALAPLLTTAGSSEVYVSVRTLAELEAAAADAGLRPLKGGRLILRPFPTTTTLRARTEVHGLRVAPWPRVFADLREVGVRGEEAAEHLREVMNAE